MGPLDQGCQTQLLGGHSPAEFSSTCLVFGLVLSGLNLSKSWSRLGLNTQ